MVKVKAARKHLLAMRIVLIGTLLAIVLSLSVGVVLAATKAPARPQYPVGHGPGPLWYFRFDIPVMPDGKRVSYSNEAWFGTMPEVPLNVTVLLYNDKEGYGIATTTDIFVPPSVKAITEKEANDDLAAAPAKESAIAASKATLDSQVQAGAKLEQLVSLLTDLKADGTVSDIWYGQKLKDRATIEAAAKDWEIKDAVTKG